MNVTKGNTLRASSGEQQSLFSGIGMRLSSGGTAGPLSAVRGGNVSSSAGGGGRSSSSAQASSARAASSTAASARAASSTAVSSSAGGGGRLSSSSARAASSTAASAPRAASSTAAWSQDSFGGDASSPLTRSPTRSSRAAEKDRLIASLELERDALLERCTDYERMVRELNLEINKLVVRAHNKKDLRKKFNWNGVDTTYSDGVIKFCKEWLFPRYKFFEDNWMVYSEHRKSLSSLVLKHCAVPDGADREDAWDRVVAPTIAKKYADMRCNINNEVRKAFQGMRIFYPICSIGSIISPISKLIPTGIK